MKLYEKIVIGVFILAISLKLIPNITFDFIIIFLIIWFIAFSYLFGGYWILNSEKPKKIIVPIVSGVALASALLILPLFILVERESHINYLFLIPNALLFLSLAIYLFIHRKNEKKVSYRNIFIRSLVILMITSFFAFMPVNCILFNEVIIALNNENTSLKNNMYMFEYTSKSEKYYNNHEIDKAIEYGLIASKYGKEWLNIYSERDSIKYKDRFNKIDLLYSNLYKFYRDKADILFNKSLINEALFNYQVAHSYLMTCDYSLIEWQKEKAFSWMNKALCFACLREYQKADSLGTLSINYFKKYKETNDYHTGEYYGKMANLLILFLKPDLAIEFYNKSNQQFILDSNNEKNKIALAANYKGIASAYMQNTNYSKAFLYLDSSLYYCTSKKNDIYYKILFLKGICFINLNQFRKAENNFKKVIFYSQSIGDKFITANCKCYLGLVKENLANYDSARFYYNECLMILKKLLSENSEMYAEHLYNMASLNVVTGNYNEAEKQYNQIINTYVSLYGDTTDKKTILLNSLIALQIKTSKLDEAKRNMSVFESYYKKKEKYFITSKYYYSLNQIAMNEYAFGDIELAEKKYKTVININENRGLTKDVTMAVAYNGLGLVETEKKHYQVADSLFKKSVYIFQSIYTEQHPFTANLYLNIGQLYVKMNKLDDAEKYLVKAQQIDSMFLKPDHDVFGDINVVFGDIYFKRKLLTQAQEYYTKALNIYRHKFNENHYKISSIQKKIKS